MEDEPEAVIVLTDLNVAHVQHGSQTGEDAFLSLDKNQPFVHKATTAKISNIGHGLPTLTKPT